MVVSIRAALCSLLFILFSGVQKSSLQNPCLEKTGVSSTDEGCECVPTYQCDEQTGVIKTDGSGLVSWKSGVTCPNPSHICCIIPPADEDDDFDLPLVSPTPCDVKETPRKPNKTESLKEVPGTRTVMECGIQFPQYSYQEMLKIFNPDSDDSDTVEGEFPWMLVIKEEVPQEENLPGYDRFVCGASLIQPDIALTAAHCVASLPMENLRVRAGEWDILLDIETIPTQGRLISEVVVHPKYTEKPARFDIAILFLDQPFELNNDVNTICLPESEADLNFKDCTATGWGYKNDNSKDNTLKRTKLPILSYDRCNEMLQANWWKTYRLHRTFLCAGGESDIDTCLGDGGGPLTCSSLRDRKKLYQIGITSWGAGECGMKGFPGAYTNLTYMKEWISDTISLSKV